MRIFVDSADHKQIEQWLQQGVVDGVTTNPSIMFKDGVADLEDGARKLAAMLCERPLSVEVTSNDREIMLQQARKFATWARNIVVKMANGNVALLTEMAKFAGLPWDLIISAELFEHYKPDPETYLGAARLLCLKPEQVMMVAAHNHDLKAAMARVNQAEAFAGAAAGALLPSVQTNGRGQSTAPNGTGLRCGQPRA